MNQASGSAQMRSSGTREPGMGVAGEIFGILTRPARAWILAVSPLLIFLMVSGWLSEERIFILLTLFVVGFGVMGVVWFYNVHGNGFLLNPLVLSTLLTFVVGFGASNYVLLTEVGQVDRFLDTDPYRYLNKAMILIFFAMVSLWAGYRSGAGPWLTGKWIRSGVGKKYLRREYQPNYRVIAAFFAVSLSCRLLQVWFGVFGYSADLDPLIRLASYTQWLTMGANLGLLALLVISLTWFHGSVDRRVLYLMVAFLMYETIFGFLSGYKAAVVMPFILTGVVSYYATDRFPWRALLAAIALLYLAYAVIEPFRALRYLDPDFKNRDIMEIASGMARAGKNYDRAEVKDVFLAQIAPRLNSTLLAACAIKYMDQNQLPPNAPAFLQDLFLSPFHALIPRFLWPEKPMESRSLWFNSEVLGAPEDTLTSVGMTPIGYLYFSGGALAIGIGFFLIGIAQRWVATSFWKCGSGSAFVYFGLLGNLFTIDHSVNAIFVSLVRNLLLFGSFQYFLFKK
jgi:hypothetical protein